MAASAIASSLDGASIITNVAPSSVAALMTSGSLSGRAGVTVGLFVPRVSDQKTALG